MKKTKPLSPKELSLFCRQILLIVKSGIPLSDGFSAVNEETNGSDAGIDIYIFKEITNRLNNNESLADSLRSVGIFPEYMLSMIELGEKSGNLEMILNSLSDYYEREYSLKQQINGAVLYPFILILMMSVVMIVLTVKVIPMFRQVLISLGGDIPKSSLAIINFGSSVGGITLIVLITLFITIFIMFLFSNTNKGSHFLSIFFSKLPLTKSLFEKIFVQRFSLIMSMLLKSGYNTYAAFEFLPSITNSGIINKKIEKCKSLLIKGGSFSEAVIKSSIFSGIYGRMVITGEKTGKLDDVLSDLADIYKEETEATISNILSIIEPALVMTLSIAIGTMLLSVMLPLMGIMSAIG